jgi:hypothetical protein
MQDELPRSHVLVLNVYGSFLRWGSIGSIVEYLYTYVRYVDTYI